MDGRGRAWLVAAGAVAVVTAAVVVLRTPSGTLPPRPQPALLADPAIAAGRVGGLLPEVVLQGRVRTTPARELRPAVLLLVRPECGCVDALRHVVTAAARDRLVTYVVEAGDSLRQPEVLAAQAGGEVAPYADPGGALAAAYRLHTAAALVLVRSDGVVTQVVDAVGPALRLDGPLRALTP